MICSGWSDVGVLDVILVYSGFRLEFELGASLL